MRALLLLVLLVVCGAAAPARAADWRWPLPGHPAVSRPFDAPASRYAAGHRGADLPSAPGTPVLAAGTGRVSYAGLVAGRGVVAVVHGELRTTYEPVTALVAAGQPVAAGAVLGTLDPGHAGCPAPACLHWGLRRGDDHLDPVRLVRPGPVRLLPLDGPAPGAPPPAAVPARPPVTTPATDVAELRQREPTGVPPPPSGSPAAAAVAGLLGAAAIGIARSRR